ncbi:hypothetical protein BDY19DRAFT_966419 [Irpex rosettiformis]|uniref:Uncharacterized protein n=1 Tax=Irpex rosettiformis TaxID=378272 RepID=A0ACB8TTD9_9APHY|nr:hypothetical protein BDY19DRAFT_966419 [Irpex rosettiformis]
MSKVVFVGNVPYHMGEEQLINAFKSVGQVVGFRLVYDRDTGKPKGYGFCEFADHDTAMSAVRNLNGQEVGGRPLRIDLADSDPFLEGKTTVRGELVDSQETRAQWRERERGREGFKARNPKSFLSDLPPGVPVPPGKTARDLITEVLATTPPAQIFEVLAQMKAFVITHTDQARALLIAHPQLGYAMFQALLLNKIVDTAVLERMLASTTGAAPPPSVSAVRPPAPPASSYHQPPPLQHPQPGFIPPPPGMGMAPPHLTAPHHLTPPLPGAPGSMYGAPPGPASMPPPQYYRGPPQSAPVPVPTPPVPAPVPEATPPPTGTQTLEPSARDMLMQVLNLTSEQVTSLPAPEREQVNQLRKQFGMPPLS